MRNIGQVQWIGTPGGPRLGDLGSLEPLEQALDIRKAWRRLPEKERLVVAMRYGLVDDCPMSAREIAEDLGYSEGRIYMILASAHRKLRHWAYGLTPYKRRG